MRAAYTLAMLAPLTLEIALAPVWIALQARGRIGSIATGDTVALLAKNLLLRPLTGALLLGVGPKGLRAMLARVRRWKVNP